VAGKQTRISTATGVVVMGVGMLGKKERDDVSQAMENVVLEQDQPVGVAKKWVTGLQKMIL